MADPESLVYNMPVKKSDPPVLKSAKEVQESLISLYSHEALRVFSDRLISAADEGIFS